MEGKRLRCQVPQSVHKLLRLIKSTFLSRNCSSLEANDEARTLTQIKWVNHSLQHVIGNCGGWLSWEKIQIPVSRMREPGVLDW